MMSRYEFLKYNEREADRLIAVLAKTAAPAKKLAPAKRAAPATKATKAVKATRKSAR